MGFAMGMCCCGGPPMSDHDCLPGCLTTPDTWAVDLSGFALATDQCDNCNSLDGTYLCNFVTDSRGGGIGCYWEYVEEDFCTITDPDTFPFPAITVVDLVVAVYITPASGSSRTVNVNISFPPTLRSVRFFKSWTAPSPDEACDGPYTTTGVAGTIVGDNTCTGTEPSTVDIVAA